MKQSRMTYEQADVLLYYLESMEEVVRAQVYSQTADAVICYGKGTDRASVLHALQKFAYQIRSVLLLQRLSRVNISARELKYCASAR